MSDKPYKQDKPLAYFAIGIIVVGVLIVIYAGILGAGMSGFFIFILILLLAIAYGARKCYRNTQDNPPILVDAQVVRVECVGDCGTDLIALEGELRPTCMPCWLGVNGGDR